MSTVLDDAMGSVRRFRELGGFAIRSPGGFDSVEADERALLTDLLREEFQEYLEAEGLNDEIAIADALADMIYIILGTAIAYGIPLGEVFREVHRSNLAKFEGQRRYREDGKLLKPEGWTPPDVAGLLARAKERKHG